MGTQIINYDPPPTINEFIKDYRPSELFYDWVIGPVGSGKTTGIFMKLAYMANLQAPSASGIRKTRAVVVRNTMPQLRDTTLVSWNYWFKDGIAGHWNATEKIFTLRYGDVECETLFRPLDTPDDVQRVLSLEVTFALIDEFVQVPRPIIDALSARLGRYPAANDGGATNWGMWGSSNPDTEDNWWYEHLHNSPSVQVIGPVREDYTPLPPKEDANAKYFLQPSGLSPEAENIDNLPGKRAYYTNQIKGKSDAWIKQFVESEWGYSIAGQPVVPTFKADMHLAKHGLLFNPNRDLVIGTDPGLGGSALILGQEDLHGRLLVLGELTQSGYGAERLIRERLKPYLRARFPGIDLNRVVIAPDPSAANRSANDERAIVETFKRHFRVSIETNNRLPLRINAIEHFTTRLTDMGPALLVDGSACPMLVRALKGGWRFEMDKKLDQLKGPVPEKNASSHPGDAFGYLCRYYHKQTEREERYSGFPRHYAHTPTPSAYHFR